MGKASPDGPEHRRLLAGRQAIVGRSKKATAVIILSSFLCNYLQPTISLALPPRVLPFNPHAPPPIIIPYLTKNPSSAATNCCKHHAQPASQPALSSCLASFPRPPRHALAAFLTSPPSTVVRASFPLPHSKAHCPPLPPNRPPCWPSAAAAIVD